MEALQGILQKNPLFSCLTDEAIQQELLPLGRMKEFSPGEELIRMQEQAEQFGVVLSGKVNLLYLYSSGDAGIMDVLEPGDLLGMDLLYTRTRVAPYYAKAMSKTRVLLFPADMVLKMGMLSEQVRLSLQERFLQILSNENMRKEYRLAILFQKGLRDRILTYLTMQANKHNSCTVTVPFTREEMASYLCVNRTRLSHELSHMAQEGLIRFQRNRFTLLQWEQRTPEY